MHQIVKALKIGQKSSRVLLDDGRKVRVPLSAITIGFLADEDIKSVENQGVVDYIHVSFYKPPRQRTEPVLCRDMSKFDASHEIKLLKSILIKNAFVLGRTLDDETLADMAEDCFLHFWERKLFQRYDDAKLSSYRSYLSRAVRNYLIDLKRNSHYLHDTYHKSLDKQVKNDEDGSTLMSLIPSDYDLEDEAIENVLSDACGDLMIKFKDITRQLDSEETTGLTFTYMDIFNALFVKGNYKDFVASTGYSLSTVNTRKQFLLDMLYPTYKEFIYA